MNLIPRAILSIVFGIVCVFAFVEALSFPAIAGYFPLFAGVLGAVLAIIELIRIGLAVVAKRRRTADTTTGELMPEADPDQGAASPDAPVLLAAIFFGWALLFVVLLFTVGVLLAALLWFPLYAKVVLQASWRMLVFGTSGALAALWILLQFGAIQAPDGLFL